MAHCWDGWDTTTTTRADGGAVRKHSRMVGSATISIYEGEHAGADWLMWQLNTPPHEGTYKVFPGKREAVLAAAAAAREQAAALLALAVVLEAETPPMAEVVLEAEES